MSTTPQVPDPQTMPLADLKTAAGIDSPVQATPPPAPVPVEAQPIQPTEPFSMSQTDDGLVEVKLVTGEVFRGTADDVLRKMAEAQVNTKKWGQEWKQKAETVVTTPVTTPPPPTPPQEDPTVVETDNWIADSHDRAEARRQGISVEQLRVNRRMLNESAVENFQTKQKTAFLSSNPDWVATNENIEAMNKMFADVELPYGWPTAEQLDLAWNYLKGKGTVKPLQPTQSVATKMPPPMPGVTASPTIGTQDPWAMDLNQLRAAAGLK